MKMWHQIPERRRIVLADDDIDDCIFFSRALELTGEQIELTIFHDGVDLMHYLNNNPIPQMLILDGNMPRKNGKECLKEIRETKHLNSLPVTIFSTSSRPEHVREFSLLGADLYLVKPDSFRELAHMVDQLVKAKDIRSFKGQPYIRYAKPHPTMLTASFTDGTGRPE
jgi:DNA-binding response OmpR family regulator